MFYNLRNVCNAVLVAASLIIFIILLHAPPSSTPTAPTPPYSLFNSDAAFPSTPHTIATFLTGQDKDGTYLAATRLLAYQLLHAPHTQIKSNDTSFLVLCSSSVPQAHKQRLLDAHVIVMDVSGVPINWRIRTGVMRWKEQFTKLRLFSMTEYKRILFIDADTMIMSPLDEIFYEPDIMTLDPPLLSRKGEVRADEAAPPPHWLFAARSDNAFLGERQHPVPSLQTNFFSAGFWMAPDKQSFTHLLSVMSHFCRFDPHTIGQSLLNYVFRRQGPMPWKELSWRWSATWPNELDAELSVVTLHEKWWKIGLEWLREKWQALYHEMREFHEV